MFMVMFPELVSGHLKEKTRKQLKSSSHLRRCIFDKLTVGINVMSTEDYQKVAEWLLTIKEDKLHEIIMDDVFTGVGNYIDESGILV